MVSMAQSVDLSVATIIEHVGQYRTIISRFLFHPFSLPKTRTTSVGGAWRRVYNVEWHAGPISQILYA